MNDRAKVSMFGINTISDYLAFCEEAVSALGEDQASVLKGFSAVLALNHLPDWLEHKISKETLTRSGIIFDKKPREKRNHIEKSNPDLELVRKIANGFKHLRPIDPTEQIAGYGTGSYGVGPYGVPHLLIDRGDICKQGQRYVDALTLCKNVLAWWKLKLTSALANENDEGLENHE
jgi:hypothetical protein